MNTRRRLLVALGAGTLAAPLACFAQPAKVAHVGYLGPTSAAGAESRIEALRAGLRELGYVEGKNLAIELRFADGKLERLPGLAAELVRLKVDIIVAGGTPAARAAQKATATIPIVMGGTNDPVGSGFVKSLARPGGNITGLSNLAGDLGPKHLELLLSMVPKLSRVAVLVNPSNSSHAPILTSVQTAAQRTGVKVLAVEVRDVQGIQNAFLTMAQQNVAAVIVLADGFLIQKGQQIADLAVRNRLPSMFTFGEDVEAGGLMSYGQNRVEAFRRAATYVDKILKGAKPADLPVEQPTKLELVVNLKTAKAIGIKIPNSILLQTDRVID